MGSDQLPPQSPEAERSLLGAMLRSEENIVECRDRVLPDCFYFDAHQKICAAIYELYDSRNRADLLSVSIRLQSNGHSEDVGGSVYVTELYTDSPTGGNVGYYAKIVIEKHSQRQIIHMLTEQLRNAYDGIPSEDVIEQLQEGISRITDRKAGTDGIPIQESSRVVMQNIDARMRGERPATLATGFPMLDDCLCGGFRNGGLTVLGARTSKGKTALALAFSRNICRAGNGVFFVSMEQKHDEITERHFAALSMVSGRRIISGDLDKIHTQNILKANDAVQPWHFVVDDRRNLSAEQIAASMRRQVRRFKRPTLVVVDYLGLVRSHDHKAQRYLQIGETCKKLRAMAGILNVPVLLLAQLNRQASDSELPELRHLKESGEIEQDADAVLLLHQEYMGDVATDDFRLIVAKQRNGPPGDILLTRNAPTFDFEEKGIPS